jgi:hypothetical protein
VKNSPEYNANLRAKRAAVVTPAIREALRRLCERKAKVPGGLGRVLVKRGYVTECGGGWLQITDAGRAAVKAPT